MEDRKYNGWTNYETWNVKLWMDNDQGSSEYWAETAQETWNNAEATNYGLSRREVAANDLAELLKDQHQENNPIGDQSSTYSDLLSAALSEVNWHEIANSILDDNCEDPEDDEDSEDEDDASSEPEDEDYIIADAGSRGYSVSIMGGKHLGDFMERDDAEAAIRKDAKGSNFFPSVWVQSDHGNNELVTDWQW